MCKTIEENNKQSVLGHLVYHSPHLIYPTGEEQRRHRGPKDLSDEEHFAPESNEHNVEYDHEAFLGKDQAERFDQLPPEEAKRRLR